MKKLLQLGSLLIVAGVLCACSGGSSAEGGDVPKDVQTQYEGLGKAAKAAGGNFDSLSESDKQAFIQRAGSEEEARKLVGLMGGQVPMPGQGRGPQKK